MCLLNVNKVCAGPANIQVVKHGGVVNDENATRYALLSVALLGMDQTISQIVSGQRHASPGDEPATGEAYSVKAIVGAHFCLRVSLARSNSSTVRMSSAPRSSMGIVITPSPGGERQTRRFPSLSIVRK